jgi:ribulose-5-phosphate 4-epimerase/fuculose-1-phosphate aldolase
MFIRCRSNDECGVLFTTVSDVRRVDFNGKGPDTGERYHVPNELPIHGEIYKARPEVGCVVHAHPPSVLVCGIAELEMRPIIGASNISAMRIALEGIPVFPHAYLVTRPELAAPMIDVMGKKNFCIMKGHGMTVTGETVEQATVRALNLNFLAWTTLQVAQTGKKALDISAEDIAELPDLGSTFTEQWVWRYYAKMAEKKSAGI